MAAQEILQLPKDQQWEFAALSLSRTAGFFGKLGAQENLLWNSTLEDEEEVSFQQSPPNLLSRIGKAGWELASSTTTSNIRGGTTYEMVVIYFFKQRVAPNDEYALAQLISPVALLKRASTFVRHNPSLSMKAIERALSFKPQQLELYYTTRGQTHMALGDEKKASDDFDKAIQANERCGEAYLERGNIAYKRADYEKAINDFTQTLRFIRDEYDSPPSVTVMFAGVHLKRGLAYRQVGKVKDALKDLKDYLSKTQSISTNLVDPSERSKVEVLVKELERSK